MKALTLLQPWASLIACGAKKIETRSWSTKYRGPIAIHAAKIPVKPVLKKVFPFGARGWTFHPDYYAMLRFMVATQKALAVDDILSAKLPVGCVIAIAELVACVEMTNELIALVPEPEKSFGWYESGRFMWILENIKLIEPVPAKGMQRLWEWVEEKKTYCPGCNQYLGCYEACWNRKEVPPCSE